MFLEQHLNHDHQMGFKKNLIIFLLIFILIYVVFEPYLYSKKKTIKFNVFMILLKCI